MFELNDVWARDIYRRSENGLRFQRNIRIKIRFGPKSLDLKRPTRRTDPHPTYRISFRFSFRSLQGFSLRRHFSFSETQGLLCFRPHLRFVVCLSLLCLWLQSAEKGRRPWRSRSFRLFLFKSGFGSNILKLEGFFFFFQVLKCG